MMSEDENLIVIRQTPDGFQVEGFQQGQTDYAAISIVLLQNCLPPGDDPLDPPVDDPVEDPCGGVFEAVQCVRHVNLRNGPGTDFADVGDLAPGPLFYAVLDSEKFPNALGGEDLWVQIGDDDGDEVWVAVRWMNPRDRRVYVFCEFLE